MHDKTSFAYQQSPSYQICHLPFIKNIGDDLLLLVACLCTSWSPMIVHIRALKYFECIICQYKFVSASSAWWLA